MGLLEAVVVLYLREILYPSGFAFPLVPIPPRLALAEVLREAATLVMLLAVAALAGRTFVDRFFVFAMLFGVWDLVYYVGLYVALGWPKSLLTWDILFLIPVPWVAPVLYPVVVSILLLLGYLGHELLLSRGRSLRPTPAEWGTAILGSLLVILSFCWSGRAVAGGGVPGSFPAALFCAGALAGVLPLGRAILRAAA
jgi:hypothetical protein